MTLRKKLLTRLANGPSTTLPLFQEWGFKIYTELTGLERQGYVTAEESSPRPERGMRPARLYTITAAGLAELRGSE